MRTRYLLAGRVAIADDPEPGTSPYEPGSLSTDFHWEVGYDTMSVSYYAHLYDDNPDEDPDPIAPTPELLKMIGGGLAGVDTIEHLQADMDVGLPVDLATTLREQRRRHFAGQLGEPADQVRYRWLLLRGRELRRHLHSVQPLLRRRGN
jgi:hypothetical protein